MDCLQDGAPSSIFITFKTALKHVDPPGVMAMDDPAE